MKNYVYLLSLALLGGMSACTNDNEPAPTPSNEYYTRAFIKEFGLIDPNHTWGFGSPSSRAVDINGNEWIFPAAVTEEERELVFAYLEAHPGDSDDHRDEIEDLTSFFLTQVGSTHRKYPRIDSKTETIDAASHMNHLMVAEWEGWSMSTLNAIAANENQETQIGNWEHADNFNSASNDDYEGNTVFYSKEDEPVISPLQFAYHNSLDKQYHNRYKVIRGADIEANGKYRWAYYVCFDFDAHSEDFESWFFVNYTIREKTQTEIKTAYLPTSYDAEHMPTVENVRSALSLGNEFEVGSITYKGLSPAGTTVYFTCSPDIGINSIFFAGKTFDYEHQDEWNSAAIKTELEKLGYDTEGLNVNPSYIVTRTAESVFDVETYKYQTTERKNVNVSFPHEYYTADDTDNWPGEAKVMQQIGGDDYQAYLEGNVSGFSLAFNNYSDGDKYLPGSGTYDDWVVRIIGPAYKTGEEALVTYATKDPIPDNPNPDTPDPENPDPDTPDPDTPDPDVPTPAITGMKRIMVEDLSITANSNINNHSSDWDFNDLVFDAYFDEQNKPHVTIHALGGTLPIYLVQGDDYATTGKITAELHSYFGKDFTEMINTTTRNMEPVDITDKLAELGMTFTPGDLNSIKVMADPSKKGDINHLMEMSAPRGLAPSKIAVPTTVDWCGERNHILTRYKGFGDWVSDERNENWFTNPWYE